MRILVLSDLWLPFPGGAERLAFNLSRSLMRSGFDVGVLTGYEYPQDFDGPPVMSGPLPLDGEGWAYISAIMLGFKPDVILTHHLYAHVFGEQLVATGIPVVQIVLNGKRLPGAALAVYISEWVKAQAGDAESQDLVITPPAFDDVIAETHGDAIGFIKPIPHKGVDLVYRIAAAMPERRFVILRGEWQDLEDIRPAPNIEFMEPVADIRDFYARVRMVLVPSLSEDAGTVAQECALNGIPCLSTDVGGLAETNGGGLLFAPNETANSWVHWIEALDKPLTYSAVTESQRSHLRRVDHAGKLALLAQRIGVLAKDAVPG